MKPPTKKTNGNKNNATNIFVSYARKDMKLVDRIVKQLKKQGVSTHLDRGQIKKGEEWWERIQQLILAAHVVQYSTGVLTEGFRWNNKTHRSLSFIAKAITGSHWSGPRFFGL